MRRLLTGLRKFILWEYSRASWQYDVMVGLILAFIFLTPRGWFRDAPRTTTIVMLPAVAETQVMWIAPEVLAGIPEDQQTAAAEVQVEKQLGKKVRLIGLEPIIDSEAEVNGYVAFAKP